MNAESLFRFCYGCEPDIFADTVIITPFISPAYFEKHCEREIAFKGRTYSGFTARKNGSGLTVIHCGMGDRLLGDAVLLLKGTPVEKVVFVGSCGAFGDAGIGDILIAHNAFDGEGFSRYFDKSFSMKEVLKKGRLISSDEEYTRDLAGFFRSGGRDIPIREGDVFTIGSLLAEERGNIERMADEGFIGIEMELSAVYSAAQAAGIKAAGVLFVSDLPLTKPIGEQLTQREKEDYNKAKEEVIRRSVEFAF